MSEISPYGEIRDFLERGWDAMGVNLLKKHLQENLQILENRIAIDESEKRDLFQIYLTIIFGVIAVPPFASEVIAPVWNILNLWQPQNEDLAKLLFIAVSMVFVTFLIIGVRRSRRK